MPENAASKQRETGQAIGHAATKRVPGRPGLEEAIKIKKEREVAEAAKRAKNPPTRSSKQIQDKCSNNNSDTGHPFREEGRCDVLMHK